MWRFIRRILTVPVFITLTCAIVLYVVIPKSIIARAEARFTATQFPSFQHSGWHPDMVQLDSDFNVIQVGSCPACSDMIDKISFSIVENDGNWKFLDSSSVPESTVQEAERWLFNHKQSPWYRHWHSSFGRHRDMTNPSSLNASDDGSVTED